MIRLEHIATRALVRGIVPGASAEVVSPKSHGSDVVEVVFKEPSGRPWTKVMFRDREPTHNFMPANPAWKDLEAFEKGNETQ